MAYIEITSAEDGGWKTIIPPLIEAHKQSGATTEDIYDMVHTSSLFGNRGSSGIYGNSGSSGNVEMYRSVPYYPTHAHHKGLSEKEFMKKYSEKKTLKQRIVSIFKSIEI